MINCGSGVARVFRGTKERINILSIPHSNVPVLGVIKDEYKKGTCGDDYVGKFQKVDWRQVSHVGDSIFYSVGLAIKEVVWEIIEHVCGGRERVIFLGVSRLLRKINTVVDIYIIFKVDLIKMQ